MELIEMIDKLKVLKRNNKTLTLKKKEGMYYRRIGFYTLFADVKIPVIEYSYYKSKAKWKTEKRNPLIIPQDCDLLL